MEKINTGLSDSNNKSADAFVSDSKSILNSNLSRSEGGLQHAKDTAISTMNDAKGKWLDLEQAMILKGQEAGKAGRIYIYQNPFKSVLFASAAGLAVGFLLSVFRK